MAIWKRKGRKGWTVDERDASGIRRRWTAPTRQTALELEAEKRREAKQQGPLSDAVPQENPYKDYTVSRYIEVFLGRVRQEVSTATWRSYEQNLRCHVLPALGHIKVCELTVETIAKFLSAKREARYGAKKNSAGEPESEGNFYSKNALRLIKAALSSLLTDCVERDFLLTANPCLAVKFQKKRNRTTEEDSEPNPMTAQQLEAFLSHARLREQQGLLPYGLAALWEIRAKTGLRPAEAYGLTTDSIDWAKKTLLVRQCVSYGKLKMPKTKASRRDVRLSDGAMTLLKAHVAWVKAESAATGRPEPYWLWPGRSGGPVSEEDERAHREYFHQVRRAAKLPLFTPYDLRSTFASLLAAENVHIMRIASAMGHKNASMILKHYGKDVSTDTDFVNALDRSVKISGTNEILGTTKIDEKDTEVVEKFGGPCRGRTYGPLIKSQLLYQLS